MDRREIQREAGITIVVRKKFYSSFGGRERRPKSPKVKGIQNPKLLSPRQFDDLRIVIELSSGNLAGAGKRNFSNLTDENTRLVRFIKKEGDELIKYIVNIRGMNYIIDTEKICMQIHDPTSAVFCSSGKHSKPFKPDNPY